VVIHRPNGELIVVTGATRTGKTTWVAHQVRNARRLLLWDGAADGHRSYHCRTVTDPRELCELVKPGAPPERIAYVRAVTAPEFDIFCRLAWVWVRAARGVLVVEELADVTHPGKAPVAWGEIIRKGLRYGPTIYALTQRPSESDKTALGNASRIHCHAMRLPRDRVTIAELLGVDPAEVERLQPFEWIERNALGAVVRGRGIRARRA